MRVLFCGGGTAGHVMPAIAMAEIIKKSFKDTQIAFVGRESGKENRPIVKNGYKLYTIDVKGLRRSLSLENISVLFKMIKSSRKALEIINEFKPDIVIGTGGYVCYPVIRAAQKLKIPNAIHESNVYPGMVTKILGKKCSALLLNSDGTREYLRGVENTHIVGNPIRANFGKLSREEARRTLKLANNEIFILSFGGSLGAEVLNERIVDLMYGYSINTPNLRHIHSSGQNNYERLREFYPRLCVGIEKCKIMPYIDDMPTYMKAADIVISRSGAMTLSELSAAQTPAILIPSPNVTNNHQYLNAKYVAERGGAIIIEEKDLTDTELISNVKELVKNAELRKKMSANIGKLAAKDVEKRIINAISNLL